MGSSERMDPHQLRHLLNELKVANLATVRPTGAPHVVPVSFVLSDWHLYFTTRRDSTKCRNIVKNNKVALSILGQKYVVVIEGTAEIRGPLEESMSSELSKAFLRKYSRERRKGPNTVLVHVKPTRILSGKFGQRQRPLKLQI